MRFQKVVFAFISLCLILINSSTYGEKNLLLYYIDNYNLDSNCTAANLDSVAMLADYVDEMESHSWDLSQITNPLWPNAILTDPDLVSFGSDASRSEPWDVVFYTGHGNHAIDDDIDQFRFTLNRSYNSGNCRIWPRTQSYLGNTTSAEIEFLHLGACHSMTVDNNVHINTWRPVFGGIHQIHGFHGWGANGGGLADEFEAIAHDGQSNAIAGEWVNELHVYDYYYGWADICPVAYTGRNSDTAATFILANENYNNRSVFSDISNPTHFKRRYIPGCEAGGGVDPM